MALSGVRQESLYLTVKELHEKEKYPIANICRILNLNRSSYYKWLHRTKSARQQDNEDILHKLRYLYAELNGIYGYRRLTDELNARYGTGYNYKRIYRLTQLVGLKAVIRRKRPHYQRSTPEITAENLLNRDFTAEKLNEKWLTDVTEFKYGDNEKLYSMSRVGRCIDNGPMEGFWGIIKCEMYYLNKFEDYDSLAAAIKRYIYFYNYERRQKKLNGLPPMTYRQLLENEA